MWCAQVDYSRCEVWQLRTLGCRPWTAWQVECEDGSSWRNAERADLADRRRGWADLDNVVPVHSKPCKPGPRFCTQYVPGHEASVMMPVRQRCGLSGEADRSVELTHSELTVACASSRLEGLPEQQHYSCLRHSLREHNCIYLLAHSGLLTIIINSASYPHWYGKVSTILWAE